MEEIKIKKDKNTPGFKISHKITIVFLLFTLICAAGFICITAQKTINNNIKRHSGRIQPGVISAVNINAELHHTLKLAEMYISTSDIEFKEKAVSSLHILGKYTTAYKAYYTDDTDQTSLETLVNKIESLIKYINQYITLKEKAAGKEELDIIKVKMDKAIYEFSSFIKPFIDKDIIKENQGNINAYSNILNVIVLSVVLVIILSLGIFYLILRLVKGLKKPAPVVVSVKPDGIANVNSVKSVEEAEIIRSNFISALINQLRTPLTSIQGFSEILLYRKNLQNQEKTRFINYINKQAENMAAILSDLQDLSEIESVKIFSLKRERCVINEYIAEMIKPFINQNKNHKFKFSLSETPFDIFIDKKKIATVLKNLISNAVKYSPEGGVIKIQGEIVKYKYQVFVEDEGIGMTPEQAEKAFDKFYRADISNTAIEGTGLGMSVAKLIIEAHGGKIGLKSEYRKGTKVSFTLPFRDENANNFMNNN
ncbi:MAG: HAMP domain-containing histidine kinase [Calditrichales bacterium]|nr:HAMP domain-containing histidine kinase [Calditrichales bacterium]